MRNVPRLAALKILTEVLANRRPLDEAIEKHAGPSRAAPSESATADRAWLTDVTSGVLRYLRRLDAVIDAYALKKKPSGKIRKILELAVYQLLHQDRVFPATVVSETVDLIRSEEGDAPARFANALLRKVADARADWLALAPPAAGASAAEKATFANLPEWWWSKWERTYGFEQASAIAAASLDRPALWFRVRAPAAALPDFLEPGPVPGSARLRARGEPVEGDVPFPREISRLPGFPDGGWIVQDLASQILVERFAAHLAAEDGAPRGAVLDRCAAPGGKAIALSWKGHSVVAADASEPRRVLLASAVARAAPEVRVIPEDGVRAGGPYRAVWVDAPCSGSGILRRHPDVRWLKQEKDLVALVATQAGLLAEAFELVAPGGLVIYSVCSLFAEEGRDHFRRLGAHAGGRAELLEEIVLGPHQTPSTDGFYAAICRRRG